ncbi:MAG: excinuclease ABC subunit UvrA [Vampirovibrionales bacterium]|nr:excinuclease ABC subunit UvrA [Vampirovibrionales bacterium]
MSLRLPSSNADFKTPILPEPESQAGVGDDPFEHFGQDVIRLVGGRDHNLQNVSLSLPRNRLIVFSGVSGSGKSTLAFDTLFAEGQRRYVESLNTYARQFIGQFHKPNVTLIEGLSPAIAIDQKTTATSPRSTVGTVTEIVDYLRVLYARIGEAFCPVCAQPIGSQSASDILASVVSMPEGSRLQILAPVVRGRKGNYTTLFQQLQKEGYIRARIDGETVLLDDPDAPLPTLSKTHRHTIDVVIDRILLKYSEACKTRLMTAIQTSIRKSGGYVIVQNLDALTSSQGDSKVPNGEPLKSETFYSRHMACPTCDIGFDEMAPRLFSFNSRYGACTTCDGLGFQNTLYDDALIAEPSMSLQEGAIAPLKHAMGRYYDRFIKQLCKAHQISEKTPWQDLPEAHRAFILNGTSLAAIESESIQPPPKPSPRQDLDEAVEGLFLEEDLFGLVSGFDGVKPMLLRRYAQGSASVQRYVGGFMRQVICADCQGARLKPLSRSVTLGGLPLHRLCEKSITDLLPWLEALPPQLNERQKLIAGQALSCMLKRLRMLQQVGVGYLSLDRPMMTLSGGEAQRIRLATQIGSELCGVLYVLDEPSIGLHPANTRQLINTLKSLRDEGNTVIVVEHDADTILAADWLVDIGPGAGSRGGQIVAQGLPDTLLQSAASSLTLDYLSHRRQLTPPQAVRVPSGVLSLQGVTKHNLKTLAVEIPLGCLTVVTGLSGAGKSSLVLDVLCKAVAYHLAAQPRSAKMPAVPLQGAKPEGFDRIVGLGQIDRLIEVDQSPIGRTPRSNPATYVGLMDHLRKVFAATEDAKMFGFTAGRFSFNTKGGRCEACKGSGRLTLEMTFLPDAYTECAECRGKRFNAETLRVRYQGKTIAQVLEMPIEEALSLFALQPTLRHMLQVLVDVGLGYLTLGQSATTLSGGEAQRVKLAAELVKKHTGKTLYIMDEPTTGLHWHDLEKLLHITHRLVDAGNTVVMIEHNLDVMRHADWIIDLGPGAGGAGGELVFAGTPADLMTCDQSLTAQALRAHPNETDTHEALQNLNNDLNNVC